MAHDRLKSETQKSRGSGWRRVLVFVGAAMFAVLVSGSMAGAQIDVEAGGSSDQGPVDNGAPVPPADSSEVNNGSDNGNGSENEVAAAPQSSGGSLPLTGGDVTSLIVIGGAAFAAGTLLVVGSKRRTTADVTVLLCRF
jgi:LPXTG-motif cell wall-anchored protein